MKVGGRSAAGHESGHRHGAGARGGRVRDGPAASRDCFANARANRLKVLVHDGIGIWLAARRLHTGKFTWATTAQPHVGVTEQQLQALVLGLPWQRVGEAGIISVV